MLRKIALSSMKGRKKDTFILSFVIILSFLFITMATIFHASSEMTKYEQRTAMFGKWDLAYYNGDQEIQSSLLELDDVKKLGVSRIIGKSSTCGMVGTVSQDLLELGSFHIYEGRMPEGDDEIALELNQLKQFPSDIKVGDTIPVRIDIQVSETDEIEASREQSERVVQELEKMITEVGINRPYKVIELYSKYCSEYKRSTQSLESFNGTKIGVKTSYIYKFINLETDGTGDSIKTQFENTTKYGSIISQKAYITRDMVVTGIIQTYSNLWDKSHYSVANAFITENTAKHLIEDGYLLSKEADTSMFKTPYNLFIDTKLSPKDFFDRYKDNFQKLRINSYLYSEIEGSTENTLTYGILLSVFLAIIFSVFLIYFTQMKRRTRRIALLKSIGATNDQIGKLLFWEVYHLLIITIPMGAISGIGIGKLVLLIMNKYGETQLNFHVDYRLTTLGVLIGILVIFISMLAPMTMSMKIPLIGTISEPPKRKKNLMRFKKEKIKSKELIHKKPTVRVNRKNKQVNLDMKIQTFGKISFKNIKYHKKKYLLTSGLYTITITVLLGCIFLSYLFFEDYINNVIITGKPSYGYEVNYGLTRDEIVDFTEDLNSIEGVTNVNVYKSGEHALLWYEGIEHNRIHSIFQLILPPNLIPEHFGIENTDYVNLDSDYDYLVKDAIVTNIYGIDVEAGIYKEFENAITKGNLNKERFKAGREVILISPIYDELGSDLEEVDKNYEKDILSNTEQKNRIKTLLEHKNLYDISYDFRKSKYYSEDHSVGIGDTIYLTIPTEDSTNTVRTNDVKVAAIIHYFPAKGIWPFADTIENPVVIGSYSLTEKLYPSTIRGKGRLDNVALQLRMNSWTPTKYGKSWIFVKTDNDSFKPQSLISLQKRARERGFKLHEYKEINDIVFKKASNSTIITVILGIAVAVITSIILYNTSLSKLEQERDRIGIFQALGVTKEEFEKQYLIIGVTYGLISLITSHTILILTITFTSIGKSRSMSINMWGYVNYIVNEQLWLYPWIIHIIICIIFFVVTILTYYLPLRKILGNQPIDNIRSLGR